MFGTIIALAVTGLVYFVVVQASCRNGIREGSPPAYIARIKGTKNVQIFDSHDYNIGSICSLGRTATGDNGGIWGVSLEDNAFAFKPLVWLFKPLVRLFQGIRAVQNVGCSSNVHSGSFAIVDEVNRGNEFTEWTYRSGVDFVRKNIRPLIALELISEHIERPLGRPSLPKGKSYINEEESSRDLAPKKLFFIVACAITLGGFVLLFKVLNKVYLDSGFNINMAVGGFFLAAILVWVGGGIILWVLGFV